jgi:dihydrofolate reductase
MKQKITCIAAIAENGVIGKDGKLPWHLPLDLKYFKASTLGKPIVMGSNTFRSIGSKPLPKRRNIVVSRFPSTHPEVEFFPTLEAALKAYASEEEIMIVGGAMLYRAAWTLASDFLLTRVNATPEGDTFCPLPEPPEWRCVEKSHYPADEQHAYSFSIEHWEKVDLGLG